MLTLHIEKKPDGNCTRMLRVTLNKFWKQDSTKQQLYGHQPPISETIQIRWMRHVGHCWRTHEWRSLMDLFTQTSKCWMTSKNLLTTALYRYKALSRRPVESKTTEMNGKRELGKSMLVARDDDDDDDEIYTKFVSPTSKHLYVLYILLKLCLG